MMNAIYFKGSWYRNYFSPKDTRIESFYVDSSQSVQVPFMHGTGQFYYSESSELNAKILRIPYDVRKTTPILRACHSSVNLIPFYLITGIQIRNVPDIAAKSKRN